MSTAMRPETTTGIEDYDYHKGFVSCCGCGRAPTYDSRIVTHHLDEHKWMMADLLTTRQITIKTVILPPGMSMEDPRLRNSSVVSRRSYWLPSGELPVTPVLPFVSDVQDCLVPPCEGPTPNITSRIQVLPEELIRDSEMEAQQLVEDGVIAPEDPPAEIPDFLREYLNRQAEVEGYEVESVDKSVNIPQLKIPHVDEDSTCAPHTTETRFTSS